VLLALVAGGAFLEKMSSRGRSGEGNSPIQRIRPLTSLADETSEPSFSPDGNYVAFRREGSKVEDSGIVVKSIESDQLLPLTRNTHDCCPVWSPDGRSIAFSRFSNKEFGIYTISSEGGRERRLDIGDLHPRRGELAWSPDGKTLAFGGADSIFLLGLEDSTVHRLTQSPPLSDDWGPAFSSDGQKVLFVRSRETGFPEEIMAVAATGGEATRITSEHAKILGPPQWSVDGQSVIFASDRGSHPALWRIPADASYAPVEINDSGWYPAVSRRGFRLAYQRITRNLNIWQMELSSQTREQHILIPSTSETDQGPGPQFSPDGKKLAYMSDRSGTMEIWVSERDGSNAFQLTAIGSAGTPRWSPDGQAIAFDARDRRGSAIYSVSVQGGTPRMLVADDSDNVCPSWSRDGQWIYFASHKSGEWQVSKIAASGGAPVPITVQGGHAPFASLDGKYIYYAKTPYANPEIWQVPVEGGTEKLLSPLVRPATWASWSVVDQGILFAGPSGKGKPVLGFFDFAKRRVENLGYLNTVPFWLGTTRDGKTAVFDQPGWEQAQIMLIENFR
jgi:Tol biopolymer transport system component